MFSNPLCVLYHIEIYLIVQYLFINEIYLNYNLSFIPAIFERLRNVLHEGQIDVRVQYMVEVMFAIRKDGFKVMFIDYQLLVNFLFNLYTQ